MELHYIYRKKKKTLDKFEYDTNQKSDRKRKTTTEMVIKQLNWKYSKENISGTCVILKTPSLRLKY